MSIQEIPVRRSQLAPLRAPLAKGSNHHVVEFYNDDRLLMAALAEYLAESLASGGAGVAIATAAHREGIARELEMRCIDVSAMMAMGRYLSLDAAETLSKFVVNDMPDVKRFQKVIGGIVAKASAAAVLGSPEPAIFGEMVSLLVREGQAQAAIRLEELWNGLATKQPFSLRCAYTMADFNTDERGEAFSAICERHSAVIPENAGEFGLAEDESRREVAKLQQKLQVLRHKKALHESEEKFRLLVEAVQDYAIFALDADGYVSSWNKGAERIKGYKAAEIIGRHFSTFYPERDVLARKPERELEIARRDGRVEDEGWRLRNDGSRFWANVVITALKDSAGNIVGFTKVTRDQTERMEAQRALEESQRKLQTSEESLRRLSVRLLRTQDEERRRIARDLHDSLGQYLSVLKMKLDSLATKKLGTTPSLPKELELCAELASEAIKEVRTISYLLYPPMLEELGLKSTISWYVEGFAKRSGIQTSFTISPDFGRFERDIELVLFRVLQESLTNVHRHSGSATAEVQLLLDNGNAILKVSDKGKGLQPGNFEDSGQDWMGAIGVGLRGMSERLMQIGGGLDFSSSQQGTTVVARVPINHQ